MAQKRLRIDTGRPPGEWTSAAARVQFEAIQATPMWQRSAGKSFLMLDVGIVASNALMEILEAIGEGKPNKRRKGELGRVADALEARWAEMVGSPLLVRSLENQVAMVHAAWMLRSLRLALDAWA